MKTQYHINKSFERHTKLTEKCIDVMRMFGLTKDRLNQIAFECECTVNIKPGDIVYITGPSGSGKTVILNELQKVVPAWLRINLSEIPLPKDEAVVDCIAVGLTETLKYLSTASLADCQAMFNIPASLSEGQQYRFRLALTLAATRPFVFADDFCSLLDRITAACIAHNIHKFADRYKTTFILASVHQDILADLLPDCIIELDLSGGCKVIYRTQPGAKKPRPQAKKQGLV